ncbi:MAG TPA: S9 family peptidase [Thermoanaerobaculia bacterium]|nr:S9 family peptidase [Thermoanaerobaculia bacterium]
MFRSTLLLVSLTLLLTHPAAGQVARGSAGRFEPIEIFELEWASDPQISPDGRRIVYVRNFADIMKDRYRSNLWTINADGTEHRPLTTGNVSQSAPRWSPDGRRLLYTSSESGSSQLYVRFDSGQTAMLTRLARAPRQAVWSPDGKQIAFVMSVDEEPQSLAKMPKAPEGAEWVKAPKVIESIQYRSDGSGYLEPVFSQIFVLSAEGGTPRQLTRGAFHHGGRPEWSRDGRSILFAANRNANWELDPRDSEIHEVALSDGSIRTLTTRKGPDQSPLVSPDGTTIAYLGSDERYAGYQLTQLYVMNRDGSDPRLVSGELDRDVDAIVWAADGKGLYFQYDDRGNTKVGHITLAGKVETLAGDLGGTTLDRPYDGGSFSVAPSGTFVYTTSRPEHPADLAVARRGSKPVRVTRLNDDLFGHKRLGAVEEITYTSSHDDRRIQAWVVKPPDFDPSKKYPLILEIHGGPFANYGDRFATDMQLYASAGYVVLYANPRGSTSYGEEFGNLIHHNYPGNDYDDLISGVDAVIEKGYVDPANLFVTGGSGGGVLTSWIIGKTDRFRAAVVAKPVINWYSFVLTADIPGFFYRYWFSAPPWEDPEQYLRRSPISLVGNVKTPTMVITGETDYRTPISESEQYYQALKIRGVPAALVRIPDTPHNFAARPSTMLSKFVHTVAWFERYRTK